MSRYKNCHKCGTFERYSRAGSEQDSSFLPAPTTTMRGKVDVEAGESYASEENAAHETEALLPSTSLQTSDTFPSAKTFAPPSSRGKQCTTLYLVLAFLAGAFACLTVQFICGSNPFGCESWRTSSQQTSHTTLDNEALLAPPYVGSTERHPFPPPTPTNAFPDLFPTSVGYAGGTPTGAEPAIIATAPSYPIQSGAPQLVGPDKFRGKGSNGFDLFRKWGNLSPWYSVDRTAFGLDTSPETPETCRVTGLHLLHRHGARYPTAWGECSCS